MSVRRNVNKPVQMDDLYALKLGSLWAAFKAEHASLWFLGLYFFFEYVRPQTLYPQFDILPWSQLTLVMAIVTAFADKTATWISGALNKWLWLLTFWVFLSGVFAFNPSDSLDAWVFIVNWVIIYYLIITVVNSEKRFFLFIAIYLLFNLKMAQHGSITWALRGFSFTGWGLTGSPGWFRNSGEYAIQMLIFGSLTISFVLALRQHWGILKKAVMYMVAVSGYMAVMGASSRGSQLGLVVILVWMLLKTKIGIKGLLLASVVAVAAYYLLPEKQLDRFREMGEDPSSIQRLVYWEIGTELVNKYPIFGIGYKNWLSYVGNLYPGGVGPLNKVEVPHNILVEIAAESGIPALVMFVIMIVVTLVYCHKIRKLANAMNNKFYYYISLGLEAGLIGYLAAGMFVTVFYYPFFWVQIGIIAALHNIVKIQFMKLGLSDDDGDANADNKLAIPGEVNAR